MPSGNTWSVLFASAPEPTRDPTGLFTIHDGVPTSNIKSLNKVRPIFVNLGAWKPPLHDGIPSSNMKTSIRLDSFLPHYENPLFWSWYKYEGRQKKNWKWLSNIPSIVWKTPWGCSIPSLRHFVAQFWGWIGILDLPSTQSFCIIHGSRGVNPSGWFVHGRYGVSDRCTYGLAVLCFCKNSCRDDRWKERQKVIQIRWS